MTTPVGAKSTNRTFLPYFIVSGSLSLGYGSIYTLLPDLRDKLGFSSQQLGVLVGVGFFAGSSRRSRCRATRTAATRRRWCGPYRDAALSALTCALSTELWQFILARRVSRFG